MGEIFVSRSKCIFVIIIFILIMIIVGLSAFILKKKFCHEKSSSSDDSEIASSTQTTPATTSDYGSVTSNSYYETKPWKNFRLPKYIIPLHYELLLHPDIQDDSFTGNVNITVNVTSSTKFFMINVHMLEIKDSKISQNKTGNKLSIARSFSYAPHEYFVLELSQVADPGVYRMMFNFFGSLVNGIIGIYKSKYTDSNNQTRYLVASKFEPTYARRAFPCFDEPGFKSTFTVSLVHKPGYTALSNMPVDNIQTLSDSELLVTKFHTSVSMVTYLVCFVVSDFHYVRTNTSSGVEFRVYSAPDQLNNTQYALKFGVRVLEYFENYFGIHYPLPKQDMISLPDFASRAMEHWGIITFREPFLLYDEENSSPQNKQRISFIISHEMAHMWFGDLVTMEWWDDLWLNEGFASYVGYKGVHEQHPEWEMLSQFVTEYLQPFMQLDSIASSHPIIQPVRNPDEITEIFDDITYKKGASVLRMLEFFVGKDKFQQGISNFLKKFEFKNAKTEDLWAEFYEICEDQGNRSVTNVLETWTKQAGYPYISVKRLKSYRNESVFTVKQKRFFARGELHQRGIGHTNEYTWSVPFSYITESGQTDIIWIHDNLEKEVTLPASASDWVKFNVNQTGLYLVNYEKEDWEKFIDILISNHERLSPVDRSNLLFDASLLAEAGQLSYDDFFSMSKYLKNETHLIPWTTAHGIFIQLCQVMESTDVNFLLKSYIKDFIAELYKNLGWDTSENHLENLLRTKIIDLACYSGNQECLTHASEIFQNWMKGGKIPPIFRNLVYHYGMSEIGQEEQWNFIWDKYRNDASSIEKNKFLYGLAKVKVPSLIHKYLQFSMDERKIRSQDFFTVIVNIARNPVGRPIVWKFFRDQWTNLVNRFTLNNRYLGNAVKDITRYFTSEFELQQMEAFFLQHPEAGAGKRERKQSLENVHNNIKWLKTYKEHIKLWLLTEGIVPWRYPRLPTHAVPEHYDLLIYPMLDSDLFNGTVAIKLYLQKQSDYIILHAANLNVSTINVESLEGAANITIDEVFQYEEYDYLVLKLSKKLQVGRYKLYFEFEGALSGSLLGLYKSSYIDPVTLKIKYLATTQFETTSARRTFPCFDEPMFKSTYNVRLVHDSEHYALSNTAVDEIIELENGLLETRFQKTLPMVSYLIAFVVCDFMYKETTTQNGIKLRVYAAPHQISKVDYALSIGSKVLTYYETYFNIPFPLEKLDMIAIPDIEPNGMENWGLITYSEEALLCDRTSSVSSRNFAVYIISHELAHMWFGDLVTMKWWDDIWLNEGFATYIAQKGIKYAEPEFDEENSQSAITMSIAMDMDSTVNANAIVQRIIDSKDGIFNDLIYQKGSALLGMLENYMGEDFRKGVSVYLKKYAYSSAVTEDLWFELTEASTQSLNVASIMDSWTKQINFPYLTVTQDNGNYSIQQHRYLRNPSTIIYSANNSPYDYVWQIPITYRTSGRKEVHRVLLNSSDIASLTIPGTQWAKFNVNFTGYFLVNYEIRDWKRFIDTLKGNYEVLSPSDRMNLLFDAFSLADAGHLDYDIPLNMTLYLRNETSYSAWSLALKKLTRLKHYFMNDPYATDILKEYLRSISKNLYRMYSWEDKGNYSEKNLRYLLIDVSCDNGNQECLLTAGNLFNKWMKGYELNPQIRFLVFKYGLHILNNEESWNFLWQKFLSETNIGVKSEMRDAFIAVKNSTLLKRFFESSKNLSVVRKHEFPKVLIEMAKSRMGLNLVTLFLFNNWSNITQTYGSFLIEKSLKDIFSYYHTEKDLQKVKEFYRNHEIDKGVPRIHRTLAVEGILDNIRWHKVHGEKVKEWLDTYVPMPWKNVRLPRHIIPTKYNLVLKPNIQLSTFTGEEKIYVKVDEQTNYILIHSIDLQLFNIELRNSNTGENITIDEELEYKKNNFWVIKLAEMIPVGLYTLKIEFSGKFADDKNGVGRYSYLAWQNSSQRFLMATNFKPMYARRMFPCFDEPDMKSKFILTVIHNVKYSALSNMPEVSKSDLDEELVKTVFQESVVMPTYLLCCIISEFDFIEKDYKGKTIRAYAPLHRLYEAEYGLNLTMKVLETYEEYFDMQYVLPKLDLVAMPDYVVPAEEHWGVITYNANHFLVADELTQNERILLVDRTIFHELAHQWFGNLVTMKWWNNLWLNEGIATLLMDMHIQGNYSIVEELNVRKMSKLMHRDSVLNSHPIQQNASVSNGSQVLFDNISYDKGKAILRMMQYALKDDFRIGLSNYLKKYAFKNAEAKDLWEELSNASKMNLNVTAVMNTWTYQIGFPYITLKRDGTNLEATQRLFLRINNDSMDQNENLSQVSFVWRIPFTYKNLRTGNEYTLWLNEKNATFEIEASADNVLKFNPDFVGYYIVKYDDDDYERLSKQLVKAHMEFSVADRYNLLHDAFVLAENDHLLYDIPLTFTKYLKKEKELLPWCIFRERILNFLQVMKGTSETIELLKKYVNQLSEDLYDEIINNGTNNRDFNTIIVELACQSLNEKCLNSMIDEFALWANGEITKADLQFIFSVMIPSSGNSTHWNILYERLKDPTTNITDTVPILQALASFTGSTEILRTIDVMMKDLIINSSIAHILFEELTKNDAAVPLLWNYTKNNWNSVLLKLGDCPTSVLKYFCGKFKTSSHLEDFITFLKPIPEVSTLFIRDCTSATTEAITWSEKYEETLQMWLRWNTS